MNIIKRIRQLFCFHNWHEIEKTGGWLEDCEKCKLVKHITPKGNYYTHE